jgi:hypothetical protein
MNVATRWLRFGAAILLLTAGVCWLASGANRGWTKTSVPKRTLDEVTGIEGVSYERRFVPGVDFLVAAVLGSSLLAGASLLFRNPPVNRSPSNHPLDLD